MSRKRKKFRGAERNTSVIPSRPVDVLRQRSRPFSRAEHPGDGSIRQSRPPFTDERLAGELDGDAMVGRQFASRPDSRDDAAVIAAGQCEPGAHLVGSAVDLGVVGLVGQEQGLSPVHKVRQDRRMSGWDRPVVVAVCGSPGAGKTTVARATARRLGVPFLTRDEMKVGLGLSSASVTEDSGVELNPDFHIAGGPSSLRAEAVMIGAARLLASSGVSFVVESSVLSHELLDALLACDARVLAVHVVAHGSVIGERLRARAAEGGAADQQLSSQFQRGEVKRSIFDPPGGVDSVIEVDTSDAGDPDTEPIEAAVVALIR